MASTSILIVDQREATQRTLKLTCKTTLTAAKLKRTYGKHTGEDPCLFVLTRPNGRRLEPDEHLPKSVFVVAAEPSAAKPTAAKPAAAKPEAAEPAAAEPPAEDDRACRYCFESHEPLISPCECRGDQRYVHPECLRQYQRILLVNEPVHPQLYAAEHDPRTTICGVCRSPYSVAPPSRRELAESFTGPELAEQLRVGSVLAVRPRHSAHLEAIGGAAAFVRSLYLITNVEKDDGSLTLELRTNSEAEALRKRLDAAGDAVLDNGRRFTLAEIRRGSGVVAGRDCLWALRTLEAPAVAVLRTAEDRTGPGGEDHLAAVNLNARIVRRTARRGDELRHRVGGVVDPHRVTCFLVPGDAETTHGHTVLFCGASEQVATSAAALAEAARREAEAEARAVDLAAQRATTVHGGVVRGQAVRVVGLPDYEGEVGVACGFADGRWRVRFRDGSLKAARPEHVEPREEGPFSGRVDVYWGDSRWSRAQLLGEIGRGHWGVAACCVADVVDDDRYGTAAARAVFAARSAMTDPALR